MVIIKVHIPGVERTYCGRWILCNMMGRKTEIAKFEFMCAVGNVAALRTQNQDTTLNTTC